MEIDTIIYKAKDGKIFFDPLRCEEYERNLGVLQGSVGALVKDLEQIDAAHYIFGLVLVRMSDGSKSVYSRCTVCADCLLEDFVNPDNLTQQQRYIYETVGNFLDVLKKLDQDLPCQYMLMTSGSISFDGLGLMANHNEKAWKGKDEDKDDKK